MCLTYWESNSGLQIQSLLYYHYTIGHWLIFNLPKQVRFELTYVFTYNISNVAKEPFFHLLPNISSVRLELTSPPYEGDVLTFKLWGLPPVRIELTSSRHECDVLTIELWGLNCSCPAYNCTIDIIIPLSDLRFYFLSNFIYDFWTLIIVVL